ncbi:flagellar biosynthesis anti-sigma factor FlgM [Bacillus canaveralius]|uniref:Negative regulator of flagellin synthesis n=1 Tax=Bacillus canaveralius TaxID=1403243 RepID=A0A2N5GMJ0_9BACI|nr:MULTISPECIES: flagellar biosynthesis anti-sigma factor FlgM [Bacillus]PLR82586.1 flagellar biosynthesis anti-sigma factor FlgM [Bacillus sp. V33-4]PLR83155.1 flagellar biosynthesis anti-sigma factor FlgM [Bacillus canaveralius]PLR94073.1 flagellar biosynthesis anti-sigma factor FlgM [Bacillus canaveralius]RSK54126.1 flagellar biosynthesis anti-sigma factor FlgM [Bacillus canaveralius]
MKINNMGPSGLNPYKRQMNKFENADKTASKASDKLEISSTAKEMQQSSHISAQREAKVEELRIQVENGNYKVNPRDVAKSLINYYFKN